MNKHSPPSPTVCVFGRHVRRSICVCGDIRCVVTPRAHNNTHDSRSKYIRYTASRLDQNNQRPTRHAHTRKKKHHHALLNINVVVQIEWALRAEFQSQRQFKSHFLRDAWWLTVSVCVCAMPSMGLVAIKNGLRNACVSLSLSLCALCIRPHIACIICIMHIIR